MLIVPALYDVGVVIVCILHYMLTKVLYCILDD